MSENDPKTTAEEVLPRRFGRYVLFDVIGRGGMAKIYLSRLRLAMQTERLMVIKQILRELSADPAFAQMLVAEAKLAAQLTHANVVQVVELGREDGQLFIAMEYVEGFDLNELLRRLTKSKIALPAEFAVFVIREVLAGLDYAHRARNARGEALGVVHRDVSPSNVLVSFEGEVKLCDFGIARALHAGDGPEVGALTKARVAGKAAYMSPEHARGEAIDRRADVFSAGVLLWELCAGRRMYRGSDAEMLALAQRGEVPKLPLRGLPVQGALQDVLDKALAASPDARYATAADFRRALEEYCAEARLSASPLKFGEFLRQHFAEDIVAVRRAREIAARALDSSLAAQEDFDEEPTRLEATPPAIDIDDSGIPTVTRPGKGPPVTKLEKRPPSFADLEIPVDVATDDLIATMTGESLDADTLDDESTAEAKAAPRRRPLPLPAVVVDSSELEVPSSEDSIVTAQAKAVRLPAKEPPPIAELALQSPPSVVVDAPMASTEGLPELPALPISTAIRVERSVPLPLALGALFAIGLGVGVVTAVVLLVVT